MVGCQFFVSTFFQHESISLPAPVKSDFRPIDTNLYGRHQLSDTNLYARYQLITQTTNPYWQTLGGLYSQILLIFFFPMMMHERARKSYGIHMYNHHVCERARKSYYGDSYVQPCQALAVGGSTQPEGKSLKDKRVGLVLFLSNFCSTLLYANAPPPLP
ncbi:hypothetical protein CsSME_00048592 [Camellia sinensis var. sinensis]